MLEISFAEFGSTGWVEMSWFHGLSLGKTICPATNPWPRLSRPIPFCCSTIQGAAPDKGVIELPAQARLADRIATALPIKTYAFKVLILGNANHERVELRAPEE